MSPVFHSGTSLRYDQQIIFVAGKTLVKMHRCGEIVLPIPLAVHIVQKRDNTLKICSHSLWIINYDHSICWVVSKFAYSCFVSKLSVLHLLQVGLLFGD